jgi:hypothetical protein
LFGWSRSPEADRLVWQTHEDRAGDLAVRQDLYSSAGSMVRGDRLRDWQKQVAAEPPERIASVLMLIVRMFGNGSVRDGYLLREPVAALLRRPLAVSDEDALLAARTAIRSDDSWGSLVPLRIAEVMVRQQHGPLITDPAAAEATRMLINSVGKRQAIRTDSTALRARLQKMLPVQRLDLSLIVEGDGWAKAVLPQLTSQDAGAVLHQLASATGSKPTKSWAAETARLLESEQARAVVRQLVERLTDAEPLPSNAFVEGMSIPLLLDERNGDIVRAAIWATVPIDEPWRVPALLALTLRAFNPPLSYIASQKVPNAAIYVLGQIGGPAAVAALATLDAKSRDNGDRKRIAAALAAAGKAEGLSAGQVLERMVDDAGLAADGTIEFTRGPVTAQATLNPDLTITVTWPGRKPSADAPKSDVNAIKRQVTALRGIVSQERRRVEGLFAEDRGWDMSEWRQYYLAHPITGRIAARLLWRFGDVTRLGSDPDLPVDGPVRLWHPANATVDEVAQWRDQLHDLRQPFKQAYREVYLLTDAERATSTYSNRFAAHVLHYNQAYALFKERGWVANYLGPYDGGYEGKARREFRDAGLTAVFEHFAVDGQGQVELCTTDRVRFYRTADRAKTAIALDDVPRLVFTEAMRDVDLFVGVASIAVDPNWADRGDDPHYDYWERSSFGELTAMAEVRRDALARILPKLAIADQVELVDRYVRVQGKRASYRIHIGSANVLIEPGDRYLCIVPAAGGARRVMVPFEGDAVLSLVLSKVVLLAADDRIADPVILSQLP